MNQELRGRLPDLRERDHTKRRELVERGELYAGYHPGQAFPRGPRASGPELTRVFAIARRS